MCETSGKELHDRVEGKDWLKKETCIRCDERGSLLICNVRGCPLAIHEACMSCKPNYDDEGKFYCPYCSYKRALIQVHKLRKKAMAAKKALSSFISSSVSTGNCSEKKNGVAEKMQNDSVQVEHDQHKEKESKNTASGIVCDDGSDGPAHRHAYNRDTDSIESDTESPKDFMTKQNSSEANVVSRLNECDLPENTNFGSPANTAGGESPLKRKRPVKDHKIRKQNNSSMPRRSSRTVNKKTGDDSANKNGVSTSKKEGHESVKQDEKTRSETRSDDGNGQPHPYAAAIRDIIDSESPNDFNTTENSSEGDVDGRLDERELPVNTKLGSKDNNVGGETPLKGNRHVRIKARKIKKQQISGLPRRSPRALFKENEIKDAIDIEGVSKSKMSKESPKSVKKFKTLTHSSGKRKRLPWTTEEEEMLREGVQKFSTSVNKNLPWMKILEFGNHIFGGMRGPIDLKDKWRQMQAR